MTSSYSSVAVLPAGSKLNFEPFVLVTARFHVRPIITKQPASKTCGSGCNPEPARRETELGTLRFTCMKLRFNLLREQN